jgi:DNA invertase Pin-like site-specific DNA recombinase
MVLLTIEYIQKEEKPMDIGYARVSTPDQSLDLQKDALNAARCELIYERLRARASLSAS